MERSLVDMTLELQNSYSHTVVTVKRGDTLRTLRIRLTDGGRPYPISPETSAVFTAVKPDGTHLYNTCLVEKDHVLYNLTSQTTALPGELKCEIRLYGPNGELLTTAAFDLVVTDTVYADGDESVLSSGEATALTRLMVEATAKILQMQAVLDNEVNHAVIDNSTLGENAWSAKKIADMLCPSFAHKAAVVTCAPLEGYPLAVVSTIDAQKNGAAWDKLTLSLSGRNLWNLPENLTWTENVGVKVSLPAGTYTVSYNTCDNGGATDAPCVRFWDNNRSLYLTAKTQKITLTKPETQIYLYTCGFSNANSKNVTATVTQLMLSAAGGSYQPYQGQIFTADLTGQNVTSGSFNWTTGQLTTSEGAVLQLTPVTLAAQAGENVLCSICGETAVTGKLDPVQLLTQLMQKEE